MQRVVSESFIMRLSKFALPVGLMPMKMMMIRRFVQHVPGSDMDILHRNFNEDLDTL